VSEELTESMLNTRRTSSLPRGVLGIGIALVSLGALADASAQERVVLPACDFEVTMPAGSWRKTHGEWEAIKSPVEQFPAIDARCMRPKERLSKEGMLQLASILAHKLIAETRLTDHWVTRHQRTGFDEIRFHGKLTDQDGTEWVVLGSIAAGPNSLLSVTLTGLLRQKPPPDAGAVFQSVRLVRP
jgi:hypothetical protein